MSLNMDQIAETFCSWRFAETFPYMADDIKWHVFGRVELSGRQAVIDQCDKSTKFLETVSGKVTKLKIHHTESFVIVEGAASFAAKFPDQDFQPSSVVSCDIFHFADEQLVDITSYVIDLKEP